MDSQMLDLLEEMSYDLKSHSLQKRLNSWLAEETKCIASAFAMVVDNYGHCFVEVLGNQDLAHPHNVGDMEEWHELFQGADEKSFEELPTKMQNCVARVFNLKRVENAEISLHAIRGTNASEFLGALFIYHSDNGDRKQTGTSGKSAELKKCIKFIGSTMRISATLEKQMARTKLNGFILTLLRNLFSNLENMTQLVQSICKDATKLIPSQEAALYLIDIENGELLAEVVQMGVGNEEQLKELRFPMKEGVVGQVATTGEMINWHNDLPRQSNCLPAEGETPDTSAGTLNAVEIVEKRIKCTDFNSVLCFPVKDKKKVIAVIQLLNKIGTPEFTSYDEHLAGLLSSYCAISISHCLLFNKLQEANRRTHVASELMMYHTHKIVEEDVLRLSLCPIPTVDELKPGFLSFFYSVREMPVQETQMACLSMFYDLGFMHKFRIKRRKMARFLLSVEKAYRDVPYHNWYHAFSVAHFCYMILKSTPGVRLYLSDVDCLCLFVACLCHDIDHRGTNNSFQLQTKTALAQLYSSEGSVLECHHFAQTMCILNIEDCNIFEELSPTLYQVILDKIRDIILATDLAQHLRIRGEIETMSSEGIEKGNAHHVFLLQSALMTACDLADQAKPWPVSKASAAQVYKEFFSQGDLEKAMGNHPVEAMDRDKADVMKLQLDFLDTIAIPLFKMLSHMFPKMTPVYKSVCFNRVCYETMKKLLSEQQGDMIRYDAALIDKEIEEKVLALVRKSTQSNSSNLASVQPKKDR